MNKLKSIFYLILTKFRNYSGSFKQRGKIIVVFILLQTRVDLFFFAGYRPLCKFLGKIKAEFISASVSDNRSLKFSAGEQILFAKRLAILLTAGVPLLPALQMLKKQANSKTSAYILGSLSDGVENGASLSAGMAKFKKIFGDFAVNIVRVGEVSGILSENLDYLAEELKKKQELKRRVISALVYPLFIIFATLGILILLVAYVFPKILPVFQSFKMQLPWSTRALIFISNIFLLHWLLILLFAAVLIGLSALLLKNLSFKLWLDGSVLRLPLLGKLFQSYQLANFSRTLGLLLKSDVRILEALKITAATAGNLAYRKEFFVMAENMAMGKKLSLHMEENEKIFPAMLAQMTAVGEMTGNLSGSLMYLAETYEDELNDLTKNLSTSIEPMLMIFMGLLVGFLAVSIITPIYGITQNLHP